MQRRPFTILSALLADVANPPLVNSVTIVRYASQIVWFRTALAKAITRGRLTTTVTSLLCLLLSSVGELLSFRCRVPTVRLSRVLQAY